MRFLHDRLGQFETLGPQDRHVHAALRCHVQRCGRHSERQGLRVVGPAQHELAAVGRYVEIVHRLPVREALAGMVHRRFHVDVRRVDEIGQRVNSFSAISVSMFLRSANARMPIASP